MADSTLYDLSAFPPPQVIEEPSFEAILSAIKADTIARCDEIGVDIRGIIDLETEPMHYLAQVFAYRETLIRARVNDAVRANLLAYATGSDLDHLAVFYDVLRMAGETDEALRRRVILNIQGRSPGGTAARYRAISLGVSTRVADAVVYRVGTSPLVRVAVYSTDAGGIADEGLLSEVRAALNAPDVLMVNDSIEVQSAIFETVNIEYNVWLLPEAPDTMIAPPSPGADSPLAALLRMAWDAETGLGFDLDRAWITARLMRPGIKKVEPVLPTSDRIASPERAISIGTITLNNMGRAY
ncbi:phage-related baseplate assembly protein [Microvirga flocculans]|uniref:Phage-related baseplate assembly protein n=1 Tax=Microvirga flocculans TaxID=217168 RepID=A0A7W6IID7_9HYPH|nr:baseplate J/gp47 family protein [Microvirga flocculans]MBB4042012.1 phage-related baseplate assembly protein [Microvirga flocculans]